MTTEIVTERLRPGQARAEDLEGLHALGSGLDAVNQTATRPGPADRAVTATRTMGLARGGMCPTRTFRPQRP